ncbi:aldehyde dehydrogenase family protein [Nonomuraea sp. NPDC003707]
MLAGLVRDFTALLDPKQGNDRLLTAWIASCLALRARQDHFAPTCGKGLRTQDNDGARAVAGGARHGEQGYFVQPVLTGTRPNMKVVREKIFGPVVVATPFSDLDEIAAQANDTTYG